jgi:hypothetical protein
VSDQQDPLDTGGEGYESEVLDRKVLPSEIERLLEELDGPDPWMWWYRLVTITVMSVFFLIGLSFLFGPQRWFEGNSISIVHNHLRWIPLKLGCIPFFATSIGLAFERTRLGAYLVGFFFASFFIISSTLFGLFGAGTAPPSAVPPEVQETVTRHTGKPVTLPLHTNTVVVGMSLLGLLLLLAGMRYVLDDRNRQDLIRNAEAALEEL